MRSQYRFAGSSRVAGQYSRLRRVMNSFSPGMLDHPSSEPSLCAQCAFVEGGSAKKAWLAAKRSSYAVCSGCGPGVECDGSG